MTPTDWATTRTVRLDALRSDPDAFLSTWEEEAQLTEKDWRDRLMQEDCATFIAFVGDDETGGIAVGAPCGDKAGLYAMWVDSRHRGKGIGGALVDAVVTWARELGHSELLLDVADGNAPAIALYESKGFMPTGVTGTMPAPRDGITEHQRVLRL